MDKTEEKIQKMTTLIEQNGALIEQSNKLVGMLTPSTEIEDGKILIADAINQKGGNASNGETLSSLATKIKALNIIDQNTKFGETITRPIELTRFILEYPDNIKIAKNDFATEIIPYAFNSSVLLEEINFLNVEIIKDFAFEMCINLKRIILPKLKEMIGSNIFYTCTSLEEVFLPELENTNGYDHFRRCYKLTKAVVPKLKTLSSYLFSECSNLIDLHIGENFRSNLRLFYSPTNAMSTASNSLVNEGEPFATNNEKWNYNLREHFAANLPDRTGMDSLTLTFDKTVLANMTDETKLAFTNKNWNLA